MAKTVILAKRPDLVIKLEKYGIELPKKEGGKFRGIAKKWAKEKKPPYDNPVYQALATRLPTGWEEVTADELDELVNKLQKVVQEKKRGRLGVPNIGNNMMLKNVTQIALLGIAIAANIVIKNGLGQMKKLETYEKRFAHQFSFEMICKLLEGSKLFELFFNALADITDTSEIEKKDISNILSLTAHIAVIFAASQGQNERLEELYLALKPTVLTEIKEAKRFLDEKIIGQTNELANNVHLYLQQAIMAIDRQDFDGFKEALTGILEILGITEEVFLNMLTSLDKVSDSIHYALTDGMEDLTQKVTTVTQAM